MTVNELSCEIYNRYGPVTRARGCFLYTKKGKRLTDLYQEDGRAILGWEGGNAFTFLKNVLSRGQTGSFICEDVSRLEKAVSKLLNSERNIFFFSTQEHVTKAAISVSMQNTAVYMPWLSYDMDWSKVDSVILEPPLPWTKTIYILAVKKDVELPPVIYSQCKVPFALQAAITRAIYNLIKEIPLREEKNWFIYDQVLTRYFTRRGPYLEPKVPEDKYDDFVLHCLDNGIIIHPEAGHNSIIPYGADKGVFTALKNNPFEF